MDLRYIRFTMKTKRESQAEIYGSNDVAAIRADFPHEESCRLSVFAPLARWREVPALPQERDGLQNGPALEVGMLERRMRQGHAYRFSLIAGTILRIRNTLCACGFTFSI